MAYNTLVVQNGISIIMNRLMDSSPTYTVPDRFKVAINTPDVALSDTSLATTVPINGTENVDDCSATSGWTASGTNSVAVDTSTFKPDSGTDGALTLIKSDATSATIYATKTTPSLNGTSKDLLVWVYIKDATALAKVDSVTVRYGSDSSNYYAYTISVASLAIGWNFLKIAIPAGFTSTTGAPTISALDWTYISYQTVNTADTTVTGDIVFDSIRLASPEDYYKAVESITVDEALGTITVVGKLSVSDANGFLLDGFALCNSDGTELLFLKSKFPSNSKDTTDLFKFTTKISITNIV